MHFRVIPRLRLTPHSVLIICEARGNRTHLHGLMLEKLISCLGL